MLYSHWYNVQWVSRIRWVYIACREKYIGIIVYYANIHCYLDAHARTHTHTHTHTHMYIADNHVMCMFMFLCTNAYT